MAVKRIECPYFQQQCLRENCVAFDTFTSEKFFDQYGTRIGISKIKEMVNTLGIEFVRNNVTREFRVWEECRKLGKMIDDRTETDHNIPSYIYEE